MSGASVGRRSSFPAKVLVRGTLALLALSCGIAHAFPTKPIKLIIPAPPGGTTDVMARVIQEPVSKALGQPLVIDYKPGAGQAIATVHVAQSDPDGYTLLFTNPALTITPVVKKGAGWDAVKSFAPVTLVGVSPLVLLVNPSVPAGDVKQFIDHAKRNQVEYASIGVGTFAHLSTEKFARAAGVKMLHVPYSGNAPATTALVGGHVKAQLQSITDSIAGLIKAGKLKALGVATDAPTSLVPGVPPIAQILPGFTAEAWFGIVAPAGTPPEAVNAIHRAVAEALAIPQIRERFGTFGSIPKASASPREFAERIAAEQALWQTIVRDLGITPD